MSAPTSPTAYAPPIPFDWKTLGLVELFEAGVRVDRSTGLIRVPYRNVDGSVHNERVVARSGRRWWAIAGLPLILFGLERLPAGIRDVADSELVICEGETDTMAVRGTLAERDGRRVYAIGIPGAGCWTASNAVRVVRRFPIVYVAGDGDGAGDRFVDAVLADVPWARRLAVPRGEDVRSVIAAGGIDALCDLLDAADEAAHLFAVWKTASTIEEWVATYLAGGGGRRG